MRIPPLWSMCERYLVTDLSGQAVPDHSPKIRTTIEMAALRAPATTMGTCRGGRTWNEEPRGPAAHGPEAAPWAASETGPAELARRFWYDSLVFDRRAIRYLIDMLGAGRLLVGSDFPAMPREEPCGRTLRSMGLPGTDLDDITWYNCFRFLGIAPPKLFSMGEHDVG